MTLLKLQDTKLILKNLLYINNKLSEREINQQFWCNTTASKRVSINEFNHRAKRSENWRETQIRKKHPTVID